MTSSGNGLPRKIQLFLGLRQVPFLGYVRYRRTVIHAAAKRACRLELETFGDLAGFFLQMAAIPRRAVCSIASSNRKQGCGKFGWVPFNWTDDGDAEVIGQLPVCRR